jgi:hypothetical protein
VDQTWELLRAGRGASHCPQAGHAALPNVRSADRAAANAGAGTGTGTDDEASRSFRYLCSLSFLAA